MKHFLLMATCSLMLASCSSTINHDNMPGIASGDTESINETDRDPADDGKIDKCLVRLNASCNNLSGNNEERIADNVEKCRHVESGKTKQELLQLKGSDKMIVVTTAGQGVYNKQCGMTKYTVDHSGIKDFKIIGNLAFMISNDGQVYYEVKNVFYELLNSKGKSYSSVEDLKGSSDGKSVTLVFRDGNKLPITKDDLIRKIDNDQTRKLEFRYYTSARSIFRDE